MRELHVVATSEDGRHVVLATRKGATSGDYRVALDDRLAAAVRGDLPRPGETEPAVVTPKEIQARLRAGESPEEIAASAGVPVTKIERYAGPVLSERERVLDQARKGIVSRSRLGESALPLGEAVDRHLADTVGVRLETVTWSARREEAGTWLVELAYVSQARRRTATWRYDMSRREVTATDSLSAALAHVEPGRRSKSTEHAAVVHVPAARPVRPRRATPARATTKAPAARTVAARPPVRAAAPVPRAAAAGKAAQTAADKAAAVKAARAEAARVAAKERAAKAAAAEAARAAAAAEQLAAEQARAAEQRAAKAAADRKAKAEAARRAKAAADKKAQAEADRKAKAAAERKAKAAAAKKAQADKARADKAKADRAAAAKAEKKAQAEAARKAKAAEAAQAAEVAKAAEAARVAEDVPPGPPTLRVVGSEDAPARRGPKEPPAAARTAPARVAGQRASVPGWADVLLSTAPVARPSDADPDEG